MKLKERIPEGLYAIMAMQCEAVGINIEDLNYEDLQSEENPDKPCFFEIASWSQEDEDKFRDKLIHELYTNTKLRKLFCLPKNKKIIEAEVAMYILMHGFKTA